jgi:hypothetical protein
MLQQGQCAILPAVEFRILPDSAILPKMGLNVSAVVNHRHIKLSTNDYDEVDVLDDAVNWSVEWVRQVANKAFEKWVVLSSDTCPGILPAPNDDDDNNNNNKNSSSWTEYHPLVWMVLVVLVLGQYGVLWIAQGRDDVEQPIAFDDDEQIEFKEEQQLQRQLRQSFLDQQLDENLEPSPLEESGVDLSLFNDMRELDQSLLCDIREEHSLRILEEQHYLEELDEEKPKALLASKEIPELVRYVLPSMVVATIVLLFSSNVSTGASVDLSLRLGENVLYSPGLFEFSLANTVIELYQAGIYPLLFLVVVFSGIWPYAKLLWMLYAWVTPYHSTHQREERLLTLDALSKFSLVDTYVLVVMLVAFRFHLDVSSALGLDVYVTPEYGFYAFLLATCLSLVLGHAMLYFHRRAQGVATTGESTTKESVFEHSFDIQDNGPKRQLSRILQVFLLSSSLAALVFLTLGFTKQSFTFEFGGLAGMALGDRSRTTYSLLSLGTAIPRSVEDPKSVAILFLQIAYYFYAVVTPVSCLVFLMILFLCPMGLSKQRALLVAAEIANAWSAVEVFVLSIVAALFQISTFASFIIGDKCDLINRLAEDFIGEIIEDTVCFTVEASVESNCWYLVAGVFLYSFVVSVGMRFAHNALDERIERSSQQGSSLGGSTCLSLVASCSVLPSLTPRPTMRQWRGKKRKSNRNGGTGFEEMPTNKLVLHLTLIKKLN